MQGEGGGDRRIDYYVELVDTVRTARPDLLEPLRRVVQHTASTGRREFGPLDVGVAPGKLRELARLGVIEKVGPARYRIGDPQGFQEALARLGLQPRPRTGGPAFDVTPDVFDGIVGYERVKRILVMALRSRAPVHILLVGPPATAKSLFLDTIRDALRSMGECVEQVEGGKGLTTSSGLVELLQQMPPETPCVLLIDELDKLPRQDMAALRRLMETGEIVVTKHRVHSREKRLVWVIAASNTERMIPREILSRFMRIRFRALTPDEYRRVVPELLVKREGVDPKLARYIADRLAEITTDPREAIRIARMAWTEEDVDYLVKTLTEVQSAQG